MKQLFTTVALASAFALQPGAALAQDWSDPEGGEEGQSEWTDPAAQPSTPPASTPPAAAPATKKAAAAAPANWGVADAEATEAEAPAGSSDHSRYASGHIGLGYFGALSIPSGFAPFDFSGASPANIPGPTSVSAPMLGMRVWFSDLVGIEGALAFGFGSASGDAGGSFGIGNDLALGVHAGLPLALFHASHVKFLVIPEVNFGFSSGARTSTTPAAGADDQEDLTGGMLLQVGAKLGAELHFGFIGVPQLAVQSSVGLLFTYASNTIDACLDAGCTQNLELSQSTISLGTQLSNDPLDVIAASLAAIYYF